MAKFKIEANNGMQMCGKEYEGDYMRMEKQFAQVYKRAAKGKEDELVAAIHLDKGTALVKVVEQTDEEEYSQKKKSR